MSLINDALKRANSGKPSAGTGDSARPLQPVPHRGGGSSRSPLLLAALFFMVACGCWFLYQATTIRNNASEKPRLLPQTITRDQPDDPASLADQAPATSAAPTPEAADVARMPESQPTVPTTTRQPAATTPDPAVPVVDVAPIPEEPAFPKLKLTGIIYHRTSPSVIVNGKALFIGETIQGARLTGVKPTSATFEFEGEKKTLEMP